jgi:glutamate carboxypeptidase
MSIDVTNTRYAVKYGKATVLEDFGLPGFGFHARDEFAENDSNIPRLYFFW